RRRHTRSKRDWSSDVCSSDLTYVPHAGRESLPLLRDVDQVPVLLEHRPAPCAVDDDGRIVVAEGGEVGAREPSRLVPQTGVRVRSEERRVGKECGGGGAESRE